MPVKNQRRFFIVCFYTLSFLACACVHNSLTQTNPRTCNVGFNECATGFTCQNVEQNKAECRAILPMPAHLKFQLPFDSKTEVVCTHAAGNGSHSWPNAFFALDLATPYDQKPATVLAAADGIAFVYGSEKGSPCPTPKGTPAQYASDPCGQGWGNRVKILHSDGYYSFYTHLEKVLVTEGAIVTQGTPIGIEGGTGQAAHRHLHWSVQRIAGNTPKEWERNLVHDGESVPFQFEAMIAGKAKLINSKDFVCPHANIGQSKDQPRLRGLSN